MVFGTNAAGRAGMVVFVLVGIALLAFAARDAFQTRAFIANAASAEGVVTGLNAGGSHPEIRFMTSHGQTVSFPQGGFIFGFRAGDRVRVLYDPKDPAGSATLVNPGALWFSTLLPGCLGLLFLMLSGIAWWRIPG